MNTRIRYVNSSGDTNAFMESVQSFVSADGIYYKVFLNLIDMSFVIRFVSNEAVASQGNAINVSRLKAKAKQALVSLGVAFTTEKREKNLEEVAA